MGAQADDKNADKCLSAGEARAYTNRDWWPNQLNLRVLHHHSPLSDPIGEAFGCAKDFGPILPILTYKTLDEALYAFRVALYEDAEGRAVFEYDKPSLLFEQFGDKDVAAVAPGPDVAIATAFRRVGK